MARCLHPITIKSPYVRDDPRFVATARVGKVYARDHLRPKYSDCLVVPCGKCLACLKNKQSSMVVRCMREAEKRGSFAFMTLTYDDDHLPISESMWRVNLQTSEEVCVAEPEIISSGYHPEPAYLDLFKAIEPSDRPRYKVFEVCQIEQYQWQHRITPSVCRLDVRTWLKTSRIQYKRDFGEPFPRFPMWLSASMVVVHAGPIIISLFSASNVKSYIISLTVGSSVRSSRFVRSCISIKTEPTVS